MAAARSIQQRLYYHRSTAGVKSERQRAVGATRVDKMGRVSCIDLLGWIFAPSYCSLAYSDLACWRVGSPASAPFHNARKSLYAASARVRAISETERPRCGGLGPGVGAPRCWARTTDSRWEHSEARRGGRAERSMPSPVKSKPPAGCRRYRLETRGLLRTRGAVPPQRTASYLARFGLM